MSDKIIFKKKTFLNFLFFLKKKFILFYFIWKNTKNLEHDNSSPITMFGCPYN